MKTLSAGYLPLEHPKGWGQVDFGLAEGEWAATGERFPFYALTISFPGSNNGVTQAFPSQNQECLLEGKKRMDTAAFLRGYPVETGVKLG